MQYLHDDAAIDANVILRYLLGKDQPFYAQAEAILEGVQRGDVVVHCDPVILSEVVFVLHRSYGVSRQRLAEALSPVLMAECFLLPNKPRYLLALRLFGGPVPHFGDACGCAAALEECEGRLFSFDKALSSVEGVQRREQPSQAGRRQPRHG